jgi:hypothetical protein
LIPQLSAISHQWQSIGGKLWNQRKSAVEVPCSVHIGACGKKPGGIMRKTGGAGVPVFKGIPNHPDKGGGGRPFSLNTEKGSGDDLGSRARHERRRSRPRALWRGRSGGLGCRSRRERPRARERGAQDRAAGVHSIAPRRLWRPVRPRLRLRRRLRQPARLARLRIGPCLPLFDVRVPLCTNALHQKQKGSGALRVFGKDHTSK